MDQINQTFNQSGYQPQYKPMTLGDWLITLLIQAIPLVGFIMLFVWAFGGGTHPSKKTWAQASLLFALIMIVLTIIFLAAMWSFFMPFFNDYNMNYSS